MLFLKKSEKKNPVLETVSGQNVLFPVSCWCRPRLLRSVSVFSDVTFGNKDGSDRVTRLFLHIRPPSIVIESHETN